MMLVKVFVGEVKRFDSARKTNLARIAARSRDFYCPHDPALPLAPQSTAVVDQCTLVKPLSAHHGKVYHSGDL